MLLWRLILNLAVNLQPPRMCVFVNGDRHLVNMKGRAVFSFASVDMYSPCHIQRVPSGPVGCYRVRMDCVVRSCGSAVM